jgi:hypothetical protein
MAEGQRERERKRGRERGIKLTASNHFIISINPLIVRALKAQFAS